MAPVSSDNAGFNNSDTHWQIFWDRTTNGQSVTEGGSSGSPLFDENKRVIGQLHGGGTGNPNCSDPDNDDAFYGKLSESWDSDGATDLRRRLRDWLNPDCQPTITLMDQILDERPVFQAERINGSNDILNGGFAVYQASEEVRLTPGFNAREGAEFVAKTGAPCSENADESLVAGKPHDLVSAGSMVLPDVEAGLESFHQIDRPLQISHRTSSKFRIQPNPFTGQFRVSFEVSAAGPALIQVFNTTGQLMTEINKKFQSGYNELFLESKANWVPGLYFVRLQTDGRDETKSVIMAN